jgi:superfamily II DNA/RNA helicase
LVLPVKVSHPENPDLADLRRRPNPDQAATGAPGALMTTTFAQLGVPEQIGAALSRRGITDPFEIQAATIADTFAGRDVCGRAPTGSGKTLAFGIPLVATVERGTPRRPRALVLVPTRELADQIYTELSTFSGPTRIGVVYGGVGYGPQTRALRSGIDVLVAAPGVSRT